MATHTSTYSISPRARSHKGNAPTLPKTKYCTMCPAQFTRTTHLNRHIRSHTNERCHRCHICGAEFTRSDLLARHKKTCREGNGAPRSRRRSCQSCVRSKVKCDLLQPCSRCASHGKECVYLNNPEEFRHRKNAAFHSANAQVHLTLLPRYSADTPPSSQGSEQPISVNSVNPGRSLLQPDAASSTPYRQSDPELHSNPVNFEFSTLPFSPTVPVAFNTELRDQRMTSEFSMQDGLQSQLDLHPHWRQPHVHDGLLSVNLDITEFPCDETRSSNSLEVAGFFPNHVPNASEKAFANGTTIFMPRSSYGPIHEQATSPTSQWHPSSTIYQKIGVESSVCLESDQYIGKHPAVLSSLLDPECQLQSQLQWYSMYCASGFPASVSCTS